MKTIDSVGDLSAIYLSQSTELFSVGLAGKLCRPFADVCPRLKAPYRVQPAGTSAILRRALALVYREYRKKNYCRPNSLKRFHSFYCFLPGSRTFILQVGKWVTGTVSLIADSSYGLPIERLFPEVIREFRRPNRRLAEVCHFALNSRIHSGGNSLFKFQKWSRAFLLFKYMFDRAKASGITDLVIAVHPRHEKLYRSMSFLPVSSVRSYAVMGGSPAIAMHMHIPSLVAAMPPAETLPGYFLDETRYGSD